MNEIINIWEQYKHEFNYQELIKNNPNIFKDMFDQFESEVLYSLIRIIKPKTIIELGPCDGWTSLIILNACDKNDIPCKLFSFDLIGISFNLDRQDKIYRKLVVGDAKETTKQYQKEIEQADFLFIDAEHSAEFANWYLNNLIPNYNGKYIWIHDWNGLYDTSNGEVITVRNSPLFGQILKPVINLMDYTIENLNETIYQYTGERGIRSPSQILEIKGS